MKLGADRADLHFPGLFEALDGTLPRLQWKQTQKATGERKMKGIRALRQYVQLLQNHGMAGVGRDLWRSSSPIPLLKQAQLEQAAQDLVLS